MNDKTIKTLGDLCIKAGLLDFAIKNRIDFLELIRSTTIDEYNRANPLYPLTPKIFELYKNYIGEIL